MATVQSIKGAALGAIGGGVVAGVVNVGLYFAGSAIGATYLPKDPAQMKAQLGSETLPAFQPFVSSFAAALICAGLIALLAKLAPKKAWTIFSVIAALVFVAEAFMPPMSFSDGPSVVILELMHLPGLIGIVGGIWWFGVRARR